MWWSDFWPMPGMFFGPLEMIGFFIICMAMLFFVMSGGALWEVRNARHSAPCAWVGKGGAGEAPSVVGKASRIAGYFDCGDLLGCPLIALLLSQSIGPWRHAEATTADPGRATRLGRGYRRRRQMCNSKPKIDAEAHDIVSQVIAAVRARTQIGMQVLQPQAQVAVQHVFNPGAGGPP
jgi:hypothetical protein